MKDEEALKNELYGRIQLMVSEPYRVGMEVPVPYKHVYLPPVNPDQKPQLEIWCFNQDIAIYRPLFTETPAATGMEIVLHKDNKDHKEAGLPFVIFELKDGQPTTHEVLAYSQKAEMIKSIFPYCRYMLLIQGKIDARTYRLGTVFDKILELPDGEQLDVLAINDIEMELIRQLEEAEALLSKLQGRKAG